MRMPTPLLSTVLRAKLINIQGVPSNLYYRARRYRGAASKSAAIAPHLAAQSHESLAPRRPADILPPLAIPQSRPAKTRLDPGLNRYHFLS